MSLLRFTKGGHIDRVTATFRQSREEEVLNFPFSVLLISAILQINKSDFASNSPSTGTPCCQTRRIVVESVSLLSAKSGIYAADANAS